MSDSSDLSKTVRLSNFELLRIFAMILIIMHHFSVHGVFSYWTANATILEKVNNAFCIFLGSGGQIGVTLFIFLTGYFNFNKSFSLYKLFSLWLKVLLISYVILICCAFANYKIVYSKISLFLFPISKETYWFMTSWMLLYIFSPLLNLIIAHMDKKYIRLYLYFTTFIWVFMPSFFLVKYNYSTLLYFFYLYICGAAFKLEIIKFNKKTISYLFLFGLLYFSFHVFLSLLGNTVSLWSTFEYFKTPRIYVLTTSICLFYIFSSMKIRYFYFINYVAASVFTVYLLHDSPFVRLLWHYFNVHKLMASPYFVFYHITICFSIFVICVIIDKILMFFFGKYISKISCFLDEKLRGLVKI